MRFSKPILLNRLFAHEDESKSKFPMLCSGYLAISAFEVVVTIADEISPPLLVVDIVEPFGEVNPITVAVLKVEFSTHF